MLAQFMTLWSGLDMRRRIISIGAAAAVFAAVLLMAQMVAKPRLDLLYAQLDPAAAGDVVAALEQMGVAFDVRGTAIFVEASQRDSVRLALASDGLPANGPQGYELLDGLSGFGTTSQMFDAAYWRAKEGELARTILSSPGITGARVHLSVVDNNAFRRDAEPQASVFLTSRSGTIAPELARGMRFLVASAVPGLEPGQVSVIDSAGRLVSGEDTLANGSLQDMRADQLRDRVQRLVTARVGPGNAVVEVSLTTETASESIVERRFDPSSRVAISTDTEERARSSQDGGQALTVASNLPDGDAAGASGGSSNDTETRERINYEVSETTREIVKEAGAITRVSVAVLVNGTRTQNAEGVLEFEPLPEGEMEALRELVASAVGFDAARGDVITIRSMALEAPLENGTAALSQPWYSGTLDATQIAKVAILGAVALILGLFVVRPFLTSPTAQLAGLPAPSDLPENDSSAVPSFGDDEDMPNFADSTPDLPMLLANDPEFASELGLDDHTDSDPVERLRGLIEARKDETVEVLHNWLEQPEDA